MKNHFITVTGFKYYYGIKPFVINRIVTLKKEPENCYDREAISVSIPYLGKIGYVANSIESIANGTMSSGRIYDHVGNKFFARIMFTTYTKIICKIEPYSPELEKEMIKQNERECQLEEYKNIINLEKWD
ncbi:HIRAN domain-containing protein [Fusobacterium sp. PH5-44]|uniref:HIRAN domain-containing protein n=1 Tax=unclassified Fusobacterium TaxID=2648384 RepID=UPI003D1F067D